MASACSARSRRVVVVLLNAHHVLRAKNSDYFLFGHETILGNNIELSIDRMLPINTEAVNNGKLEVPLPNNNNMGSSRFPLGILLQDILNIDDHVAKMLRDVFHSLVFYCMVLPNKGDFSKMVLIIPMYAVASTPEAEEDILLQHEIIIACLEAGKSVSPQKFPAINIPCWRNLQDKGGHTTPNSFVHGILLSLNHFSATSILTYGTYGLGRAVFKFIYLLLVSLVWIINSFTEWHYLSTIYYVFHNSEKYLFVAKQLSCRFNQVLEIMKRAFKTRAADTDPAKISCGNKILSIFTDVILGLIIVLLLKNQDFSSTSTWLIVKKYTIAEYLQDLLKWLMGVPAGLKLNEPLNKFLGNFYTYHVHLWTRYLYFIEAYLPTIIYVCSLSGCLGITFLMSVVCDVLSLLTIHIYCFYIYAARLYSLEIYALWSLLRLFTGKKWNILRNRVDSLEYDVDRLFIGTLLFTILLFLFPTILLYYTVFTVLQLFVLTLKAVIFGVVSGFNYFPFWDVFLYVINSSQLPGRNIVDVDAMEMLTFTHILGDETVNAIPAKSALFLSLKHQCFTFSSLFKSCYTSVMEATYYNIFGANIMRKLFTGQLFGLRS